MSKCFLIPPVLRLPIAPIQMCLLTCFLQTHPQGPGLRGYLCPAPCTPVPMLAGGPGSQHGVNLHKPRAPRRCGRAGAPCQNQTMAVSPWCKINLAAARDLGHGKRMEQASRGALAALAAPPRLGPPFFGICSISADGRRTSQRTAGQHQLTSPKTSSSSMLAQGKKQEKAWDLGLHLLLAFLGE